MSAATCASASSVVHLVQGETAAGTLRRLGDITIAWTPDNLAYGPCATGVAEHRRIREAFWKHEVAQWPATSRWSIPELSGPGRIHMGRSRLAPWLPLEGVQEVVIWSSVHWPDFLFGAWAIAGLKSLGFRRSIRLAGPAEPGVAVAWMSVEMAHAALSRSRTLRAREVQTYAAAYRAYCGHSPPAVVAGLVAPPWSADSTQALVKAFLALLPRRHDERRMRLSCVDEALLSRLSVEERRGRRDIFGDGQLNDVVAMYGELAETRLWKWAALGRGRFVEGRIEDQSGRRQAVYRLTQKGVELLEQGLERVSDVPALQVGGCDAYGSGQTWEWAESAPEPTFYRWYPQRSRKPDRK